MRGKQIRILHSITIIVAKCVRGNKMHYSKDSIIIENILYKFDKGWCGKNHMPRNFLTKGLIAWWDFRNPDKIYI